jgi:hypothetical protein
MLFFVDESLHDDPEKGHQKKPHFKYPSGIDAHVRISKLLCKEEKTLGSDLLFYDT